MVGVDVRPIASSQLTERDSCNLTHRDAVASVVRAVRPDVVFHLAGTANGVTADVDRSNVETTRVLLDVLREHAPEARVVAMGSAAEYGAAPRAAQPVHEDYAGQPVSPYGRAKAHVSGMVREAAQKLGQQACIARPFNVIGAGAPATLVAGALVERLRAAARKEPPRVIHVGRTAAVRDFVAVEDVCAGLLAIAARGRPGEAYNLCTGEGHSVAELLERLIGESRLSVTVVADPGLARPADVDTLVGDWGKARRELGWRPLIPFAMSVAATWGDVPVRRSA